MLLIPALLILLQSLLGHSPVQTTSALQTSVQRVISEASQAREAGVDDWQVAPKLPEWPINIPPSGGVPLKAPLPSWAPKPNLFWTSQTTNTMPIARDRSISRTSSHMLFHPCSPFQVRYGRESLPADQWADDQNYSLSVFARSLSIPGQQICGIACRGCSWAVFRGCCTGDRVERDRYSFQSLRGQVHSAVCCFILFQMLLC